jgi:hypothetical protein
MSPRRDSRRLIRHTTLLITLLAAGCVFSPKKDPGPPPVVIKPAQSQTELISNLSMAYQTRNYDWFSTLFSTAEDSAAYFFFLNDPPGANWDLTEELRIQRRMFKPEDPLPGETPVETNLWLLSIDIHLEPQTEWTERPDLYRSATNPSGLNPARYKVTDAIYHTYVLFSTQGTTNYQVNGRANFVVVEDLRKQLGDDRKFLIYRWEDLGSLSAKVAPPAI